MSNSEIRPRPIRAESEDDLDECIFWNLVEEGDVTLMARCPVNSSAHLTTGIEGKVEHLVSSWMCDHFERTNDAGTFNERLSRWAPRGLPMRELIARIARRIHAHHRSERRHPEGPEHPPHGA